MKRLAKEIETLNTHIHLADADTNPVATTTDVDLCGIARDAATLDRNLDGALGTYLVATHRKRRTREDLGRAARRACVFAAGFRGDDAAPGHRGRHYRRLLARAKDAESFWGLSPELLEFIGAMDGGKAAVVTARLAKALGAHLDAEAAASSACETYTHLLNAASWLAGTLGDLNRSLGVCQAASPASAMQAAA